MLYFVALSGNIALLAIGWFPLSREAYGPKESWEIATERNSGCWIQTTVEGDGGKAANGDLVVIDCKMVDRSGTTLVDTYRTGIPIQVRVGSSALWSAVLFETMRDEVRYAEIPKSFDPRLANDVSLYFQVRQIVRSASLGRTKARR